MKREAGRLPFIDFGRGVVMVLMAWDHVSAFWNPGRRGNEGLMGMRPVFPDQTQFLLRFVTHFAAPTFVFLAGASLALSTAKRLARGQSQRSVSLHMVVRGVVLLGFEALLVAPAFELPPTYFGVIACIGVCLILFSVLRFLPPPFILILSVVIILGHPFLKLDSIPGGPSAPLGHYLRVIIHEPGFEVRHLVGLYPVIPWVGVMGLGWCFGLSLGDLDRARAMRLAVTLALAGVASFCGWFVVRLANGYGNLLPRVDNSLQGWLTMSKYPPSLAFLLFTLGGMVLFLAVGIVLQERSALSRGVGGAITALGQVPLFFYVTHLWIYRLLPLPFVRLLDPRLLATAVAWVVGLVVLWVLCGQYARLKQRYPRSVLQYV